MRGNSTPFYKIEYNVDHHREAPTQIDMYLSNPTCDRSAATSRGTLEMLSWIGVNMHFTCSLLTKRIQVQRSKLSVTLWSQTNGLYKARKINMMNIIFKTSVL